ncbi:MAG: 3'-5' exonuclease [Clostridia bacterium]|nr:3'-5' exonuclease [Clostridia bacterium]
MVKYNTPDFTSFVCFDFETTGLYKDSRVIEIGAVMVKDGYMVSRYSSLVDPGVMIEPTITKLTGISNEMVEGKPCIEQLIPSFYAFCENLPLVAHNASFDARFLERDSKAAGYFFDNPLFDTLSLARKVLPNLPSYKLNALTALLGIPLKDAHRAWCDAEATARLYMHLRARMASVDL